jgi:SAM-dependent methyltransferase
MSGCNNGVMRDDEAAPRWNHNIHYHRIVLEAVPESARTALDIGTGNGLLAADLRERVPHVTAIDADESVLADARADHDNINWVQGDVMRYDFGRSFDVVASVATLHHLPDLRAAARQRPRRSWRCAGHRRARPHHPTERCRDSSAGRCPASLALPAARILGAHRTDRVAAAALVRRDPPCCLRTLARRAVAAAPDVVMCAHLAQTGLTTRRIEGSACENLIKPPRRCAFAQIVAAEVPLLRRARVDEERESRPVPPCLVWIPHGGSDARVGGRTLDEPLRDTRHAFFEVAGGGDVELSGTLRAAVLEVMG